MQLPRQVTGARCVMTEGNIQVQSSIRKPRKSYHVNAFNLFSLKLVNWIPKSAIYFWCLMGGPMGSLGTNLCAGLTLLAVYLRKVVDCSSR